MQAMKGQLLSSSSDDDEYDLSKSLCCWWRSAANSDECIKLNISGLTPRLRLLRELERLALVAPEGLNEVRHKLISYRSGDFWVPIGGINKEDMNIPPAVTILLVGFSGSGKSSLTNLMYSVLGRSGLIPFARTSSASSNHTSMCLQEHNVLRSTRSGFCVYDSRGFDYARTSEALEEVASFMSEGVHHNQPCFRRGDDDLVSDNMEDDPMLRSSSKFVTRKVNCVFFVANVAEIYKALKSGDQKPLEATRQVFTSSSLRTCHENPILILTHGDLLSTEDRIEARLKISEFLGISEATGAYDIVCLTEYGFVAEESDPVTAYALSEAIYRALLISDRAHLPKRNHLDWVVLVLTSIMCFLGCLFTFLAQLCSKLGQKHKLKM